jgi:hypothetical protein
MDDATAAPRDFAGFAWRPGGSLRWNVPGVGQPPGTMPGPRLGTAPFTILDIDPVTLRGYVLPAPMLSESDSHAVGRLTCRAIRPTVPAWTAAASC